MAVVNINCTPNGVHIEPEVAIINRIDQEITWHLHGGTWQPDGIILDENPPPPLTAWPGPPAQRVGDNYVADAGDRLPDGSPVQNYRYTIKIIDQNGRPHHITSKPPRAALVADAVGDPSAPMTIDPGIENQPLP